VSALVTRFPRPDGPAVEVHARFSWDSTVLRTDSVALGVFVHERTSGRLVNRALAGSAGRRAVAEFGAVVPVAWGRLQLSLEGLAIGTQAAVQQREVVDLRSPPADSLVLSDLLLGDSLAAPGVVGGREDVRPFARTDSIYPPGAAVALYWEIYGLRAETAAAGLAEAARDSAPSVRFRTRLTVQDAGGRSVGGQLIRGLVGVLRLRRSPDQSLEWDVERPARGRLAAEVLTLGLPDQDGSYRISVTVTELASGRTARSERVIRLERPDSR
jgi:hypothetical protein